LALFKIRDILIRIRILGWDPYTVIRIRILLFTSVLTYVNISKFFCLFLTGGTFTSVIKDNTSWRRLLSYLFLLVGGRIWIDTNKYGSGSGRPKAYAAPNSENWYRTIWGVLWRLWRISLQFEFAAGSCWMLASIGGDGSKQSWSARGSALSSQEPPRSPILYNITWPIWLYADPVGTGTLG
jgi:hypothetical protein